MDCSQLHEYSLSDRNMLFICLPAAQYVQHTNIAYPINVLDPDNIPNHLGAQDTSQRAMLWHNYCSQKKWYNNTVTMNSSPIDRFLTLMKPTFREEYKLPQKGNCKQTFQACFQWFLDEYAYNDKVDRTAILDIA